MMGIDTQVFHIEYTTVTHNNTATVLASDEIQVKQLISNQPGFEGITSIIKEDISSPQIIRDSGWRKGFLQVDDY
jgi:hypothetical protein